MAKVITITAEEVEAGDYLVIREGRVRKFFHVCEVIVKGRKVEITYDVPWGFAHMTADIDDDVKVRDF